MIEYDFIRRGRRLRQAGTNPGDRGRRGGRRLRVRPDRAAHDALADDEAAAAFADEYDPSCRRRAGRPVDGDVGMAGRRLGAGRSGRAGKQHRHGRRSRRSTDRGRRGDEGTGSVEETANKPPDKGPPAPPETVLRIEVLPDRRSAPTKRARSVITRWRATTQSTAAR